MKPKHYDVNNKRYDVMMKPFYENVSMEAKIIENAVNQHLGDDRPPLSPLEETAFQEAGCVDSESNFWAYARKDN